MVKLTIDHIPVEVKEGVSVMEAASILGITIPSMCYRHGYTNHPSCMVCMVKELDSNQLFPSCAMPVSEGMNISTDCIEVTDARREALELLLSDHVGDCEAPCRLSCPAFMDIPLMNRLIASGDFEKALRIAREEIALPLVLGYICPAPCEKACKRKPIDQAVSICLLKRSAAQYGDFNKIMPTISNESGKRVAIIGAGPAGLSAAFYLLKNGHGCVLFDQHEKAGGAMQYDIPDDRLPKEMLEAEIAVISRMGAEFSLGVKVTGESFPESIRPGFDAVILAMGNGSAGWESVLSAPGVFVCGDKPGDQKMAVHSVARGKMAALQVENYLAGQPDKMIAGKRKSISAIGPLMEPEWKEYLKESIPGSRLEPMGGVLQGFSREEAMQEALRCMHCDCRKPDSCKLRTYGEAYGANRRRFAGTDRNLSTRSLQHEFVVYEAEKCIRCGLCVEIATKHGEPIGLTFAGRGFDVRISVPFHETMMEALTLTAAACVEACPTGALAFKNSEERSSG
ncbi:MAG: 2Fe-2S iron-sulfur cluster-binding protein [Bacteroidales bacterium]